MVDWFLEQGEKRVELARGNCEGIEQAASAGEWKAEWKVLGVSKRKLVDAIEMWNGEGMRVEMCQRVFEKDGDVGSMGPPSPLPRGYRMLVVPRLSMNAFG